MNIDEIREKYPQYGAMSDQELARRLYEKDYSGMMTFEEFGDRIGLQAPEVATTATRRRPPRSIGERMARPFGLTARYLAEGLSETADIFTNPIRAGLKKLPVYDLREMEVNTLEEEVPGVFDESTGEGAARLADEAGLPAPETPAEEVVGKAAKLVAGTAPFVGTGQVLTKAGTKGLQEAGKVLTTAPATQAATAASAAAGGEYVKQEGGGVGAQLIASLTAGMTPTVATSIANQARTTLTPMAARVDDILASYDMRNVPLGVVQNLRQRVDKALRQGDLDEAALKRLVAYAKTGATPTRGKISRDPVDFGIEENLARTGAQSTDENIQQLARIKSGNIEQLIRGLDDIAEGTTLDLFKAGEATIESVSRRNAQFKAIQNALYAKARDTQGRALPLRRDEFIRRADTYLRQGNLNRYLPPEVRGMMNDIAYGIKSSKGEKVDVPFNVDVIDSLESLLATEQRNAKGSAKAAIAAVKRALVETDIEAPEAGAVAQESLKAFRRARRFSRKLFQWQEKTPAIKAIVDGEATPDQFVKEFIIGETKKASVDNLAKTMKEVTDPEVKAVIRTQVAAWIRNQATNNKPVELNTFSQQRLNNALNKIGDRKLDILFGAKDRKQLRTIGQVGELEQVPPVGAAINYSHTFTSALANFSNWIQRKTAMLPGSDLLIRQPAQAISDYAQGRGVLEPVISVSRETTRAPVAIPLAIGAGKSFDNAFNADDKRNR